MTQRTIPQLFETSVERYGNNILLWEKREEKYEGTTYRACRDMVYQFAAGLLGLGIQKGDRVALIAEGRNDWVISELGILYTGAINVPLSVKLNEQSELKFRLAHSGCRMAIVSSTQAPKVQQLKNSLPDLEKIILLDPAEQYGEDELPLQQLYKQEKNIWQKIPLPSFIHGSQYMKTTRQISAIPPARPPILKELF